MSLKTFIKANFDKMSESERKLWLRTYGTVHSVRTLALAFVLSLGLYYWYKYWVPDQDLPCEDRLEKLELEYEKELSETNSEHAIEIDECSTKLSGIRKLSEQGF